MGFKNRQSNEVPGPEGLELKKKQIIQEIANLGIEHARTLQELNEIKSRKQEVKDVKVELSELVKKEKNIKEKLLLLSEGVGEEEKKLFVLKAKYSKEKKDLRTEMTEEETEAKKELEELEKEKVRINNELVSVGNTVASLGDQKGLLSEKVERLDDKVVILEKYVKDLEKIKDSLSGKKELANSLNREIGSLEVKRDGAKGKLKELREKIIEVQADYNTQLQKFNKFAEDSGDVMDNFEAKIAKETKELDERAGLVSEKEAWIKDKERDLRKAKAELEKHFNRKITHIII